MKIFLILLISFAFGQDSLKYEYDINDFRELPIPLGLFLDYAEECYNDSVKDYHHLTYGFSCLIGAHSGCLNSAHKDSSYYRHSKPTFKGFIEWLNKK